MYSPEPMAAECSSDMSRRCALQTCLQAAALGLGMVQPAPAHPMPHVVFLNPGEPVERGTGPLWRTISMFMAAAAKSLGINLEICYAERDHLLMLRQASELALRAEAPDYVVIVNEKMAAPQMIKSLARSSAKVFVIHNDLTADQRREISNERERYPNWIGSAVADNARGGYLLIQELYRQLHGLEPRVIGITGDPSTPVSEERARGVQDYVDQSKRGRTTQLVHGDWSYADGKKKTRVLLARYPDTNIIWAANDSMALGALQAVRAQGAEVLVGGMGGWPDALQSIAEGQLAATAAGHYLIGAWAVVMLYDYANGRDFADYGGPAQKLDFLYMVDRNREASYRRAIFRDPDALDFKATSKFLHPRPGPYDFRLEPLLRVAKGR